MVGGLFDLLGSGSTMPQRGIALPLIAFFAAVPTPVLISNRHHLFVQIVIEIIRLPALDTIRAIIIGTSRAPPSFSPGNVLARFFIFLPILPHLPLENFLDGLPLLIDGNIFPADCRLLLALFAASFFCFFAACASN